MLKWLYTPLLITCCVTTTLKPALVNFARAREDCAAIIPLVEALPEYYKHRMQKLITRIFTTTTDPQKITSLISQLKHCMQNEATLPLAANRTMPYVNAFDLLQNSTTNNSSLNAVWHALMYCGILCIIYTVIVAIQDNDARGLLKKKGTAHEAMQSALIKATNTTIAALREQQPNGTVCSP